MAYAQTKRRITNRGDNKWARENMNLIYINLLLSLVSPANLDLPEFAEDTCAAIWSAQSARTRF